MIFMLMGNFINLLIYFDQRLFMHFEGENIVRFINTYTAAESRYDRSEGKNRKRGITRVTQPQQSLSKEKNFTPLDFEIYPTYNNENHNVSNNKQHHQPHQRSYQELVLHISSLQNQLLLMEKEKLELQRQLQEKVNQPSHVPSSQLVESHYITCKEDIERWNNQKQAFEEQINTLTLENNFLKMNVGIQEQYILKVQQELDQLRTKQNQTGTDCCNQTQEVPVAQKQETGSQCLYSLQDYSQLQSQIHRRTKQYEDTIGNLQVRNTALNNKNDEILVYVAKLQSYREEANLLHQTEKQKNQRLLYNELQLKRSIFSLQEQIRRIKQEQQQKDAKLEEAQSEIRQLERYREELQQFDVQNIKRQREREREDARYLIKKLDQYEITLSSLKRQNQTLIQQLSKCQEEKTEKTNLLEGIRLELLELSHQYQQKTGLYARTQQEKVELIEQLQAEKGLAQNVRNELQSVRKEYSSRIRQVEVTCLQMQRKLQREADDIRRREEECEARIAMVKKDYDVLYSKYLKYKNIALLLQPKDKH